MTGSGEVGHELNQNTVHALMVAKTLLAHLRPLCTSSDRYLATAGLIALQDALELVVFGSLMVLGVDEERSLKKVSFDELLGELRRKGIKIPNLTKLKSLNEQRVLAKHAGEVAEPVTVRSFHDAALRAIDSITLQVLGKSLTDFFVCDVVTQGKTREHLKASALAIDEGRFLDSMVACRKAFYLAFEKPYDISGWSDFGVFGVPTTLDLLRRGGLKAPEYMRNREWIEHNVIVPTDYVQVDSERWRLDALELGISTADLANVRALTPSVYRAKNEDWFVVHRLAIDDSEAMARRCFDLVLTCVLKKQEHLQRHESPSLDLELVQHSEFGLGVLRARPQDEAEVIHTIQTGYSYQVGRVITVESSASVFHEVRAYPADDNESDGQPDKQSVVGYRKVS